MPRSEKISWPHRARRAAVLATIGVSPVPPDAKAFATRALSLFPVHCPARIDQTQVDRGVSAVGDDREQYIVTGLRRAVAFLDRGDALIQQALVRLEGRGRLATGLPDAGTFTKPRRSSGSTTSAKERNMAISSGTLTNCAKRVTGRYLPEGCSSSSVEVSPKVDAHASNSCRPRAQRRPSAAAR